MFSENLNDLTKKVNQSIVSGRKCVPRLAAGVCALGGRLGQEPGAPRPAGDPQHTVPLPGPGLTSAVGAPVTSGPGSGPAAGPPRSAFQSPSPQARPEAPARRQPTAAGSPEPAVAGPPPGAPACLPVSSPVPAAPIHRGARGPQIKSDLPRAWQDMLRTHPQRAMPNSTGRPHCDRSCLPAFVPAALATCWALLCLPGHF